jgi:hypothetical protein
MISDTPFLSLRGAQIHQGDEAISVDVAGNEIATPRQVGARNDTESYYPMLQVYYKVSPIHLN